MSYSSIQKFLSGSGVAARKSPLAIILVEDDCEVEATVRHHIKIGFEEIAVVGKPDITLPDDTEAHLHHIVDDLSAPNATSTIVNTLIRAMPGRWMYYCYNAEFLFFPFCETRTIGEMLAFSTEERRDSVLTYVIDLYAGDLGQAKNAVSIDDAHLDQSGYYAQARKDGEVPLDRQLDMFGGLRWRFEEHVNFERRKIDRIGLFRAQTGLELRENHTFNIPEHNTYACEWHNNITATVCSFRAAKSLKSNPGSAFDINTFKWHYSKKFDWHSQQLLDLGLMEPGQWF